MYSDGLMLECRVADLVGNTKPVRHRLLSKVLRKLQGKQPGTTSFSRL